VNHKITGVQEHLLTSYYSGD